MNLYTIFDSLAQKSGPLMEAENDKVAIRQFQHMFKNVDHKGDFTLHCVGRYDHDTMRLFVHDVIDIPRAMYNGA